MPNFTKSCSPLLKATFQIALLVYLERQSNTSVPLCCSFAVLVIDRQDKLSTIATRPQVLLHPRIDIPNYILSCYQLFSLYFSFYLQLGH